MELKEAPRSTLTSAFSSPDSTEVSTPQGPEVAEFSCLWSAARVVLIPASTSCGLGSSPPTPFPLPPLYNEENSFLKKHC